MALSHAPPHPTVVPSEASEKPAHGVWKDRTMRIMTTISGGLAAAARSGTTNEGREYANFRIGVDHEKLDRETGEYMRTGTSWFDVSAYGKLAKNSAFCLQKGDRVIVTGELRLRDWDNGERTGTSGSITARAIGPDLNFGVAPVTRNQTFSGPRTEGAEEGEGEEPEAAEDPLPGEFRQAGAGGGEHEAALLGLGPGDHETAGSPAGAQPPF